MHHSQEDQDYVTAIYSLLQTGKSQGNIVLLKGELDGVNVSILAMKDIDAHGKDCAIPFAVVMTGEVFKRVKPL